MKVEVLVMPRSRRDAVEEMPGHPGVLRVRTRSAAFENKANIAVIALLADYFSVSKSAVRIVRGHTARRKIVEVQK